MFPGGPAMARGKLPIFERTAADGRLLGYQVRIRKPGFPSISKQFDRKADAEKFAIATLRDIDAGAWVDRREVDRTTLRDAFERYLAEISPSKKHPDDDRHKATRWLESTLADVAVGRIRATDIAMYRDQRIAAGKSGNTVRLELALISHLFSVGRKEWGWPVANPVADVRSPKLARGRERRLNPGEEEKLLAAASQQSRSPWLAPAIKLALATAMRRGEITALMWDNVDIGRCTAYLPETKNGTARTVPLSLKAVTVLKALPRATSGRVFPIEGNGLSHAFTDACRRAGIEGLHFHDLRHEATSRLFEDGFAIQEVAAITGHQTLQMLKRYTHLRAEDLAKKMR